jgi:hypothetical protein
VAIFEPQSARSSQRSKKNFLRALSVLCGKWGPVLEHFASGLRNRMVGFKDQIELPGKLVILEPGPEVDGLAAP